MKKIRENDLLELGFKREDVSAEESGGNAFYYFTYSINDEDVMISNTNDESPNGFNIELWDMPSVGYYDDLNTLKDLIRILNLGKK